MKEFEKIIGYEHVKQELYRTCNGIERLVR